MFSIDYNKNIKIIKGDTGILNIELENYIFTVGDIAYFSVKKDISSDYTIHKIINQFQGNKFSIQLDKIDTNIEVGNYIYDIQLSLLNGIVDTIVPIRNFEVLGGVTSE